MRNILHLLAALLIATGLSCNALAGDSAALAKTVVAAPDRSPEDRALDAARKPAELLAFVGIQPGWVVADLGAGGGYTTELLKRAVGADGTVYAQNAKAMLEKFLEKPWSARLASPAMDGVVRLDREFDDPFPDGLEALDAVTLVLFYHDAVWLGVDRAAMNKAVFEALKPGCLESDISAMFGGENVVQFGPSSALPHGASGPTPLQPDQAVLIDAWDKLDGYYYDITRSTFFGT
ncbi:MAG: M24 family metallopeptidase, partial [Betaproteobacteria bacterium]